MFGIGSTELLVILVVALIALGPRNLAGAARGIGKMVGEFRRVSADFQRTLNAEVDRKEAGEKRGEAKPAAPGYPPSHADLPEDSPVAQALSKARAEAEGKKNPDGQNG